MTEKELAKQMAETAEMSFNNIVPDYKGAIMDYQGYFGNGKYDLRRFAEECDKLGYDVLPLEQTPYAVMPLVGKLVVEKRRVTK